MKNMFAVCLSALVSSSLLLSQPAFGGNSHNIESGQPAIIKVHGGPIGIRSFFVRSKCRIEYGLLPSYQTMIAPGKSHRVKVIGGDDIVVLCNGANGITITLD